MINGIIMVKKAPDVSTCQSWPREPTISARRVVTRAFSFLVPRKTRATSRSFHTHRNWKMAKDAIEGFDRGNTSLVKLIQGVAPSAWADSIISFGIPEI